MILADTSIWIDHLRQSDLRLTTLLGQSRILIHPFVLGEIALGSLRQRELILAMLRGLPAAPVADESEVRLFIEAEALHGTGLGYVDVHLLASARLMPGASLWTRDRRLGEAAARLGVATPAV